MKSVLLVVMAVLLGVLLVACGDTSPERTRLPDGVVLHLDQSRIERKGREAFVRVENNTDKPLTITRLVLRSQRFPTVEWSGSETVGATYDADLELKLPRGRCGDDLALSAQLTYRVGDGPLRVSTGRPDDPYGAATLLLDRDCARRTFEAAADVKVGEPSVTGTGRASVFGLPVTLAPTGARVDVDFGGFESTPLFRQTTDSGPAVGVHRDDPVRHVVMRVQPARCDLHALAEDKVGTLFGVRVVSPAIAPDSSYYLPLDDSTRAALFDYLENSCGFD